MSSRSYRPERGGRRGCLALLLLGLLGASALGGAWWAGWLDWERLRSWAGGSAGFGSRANPGASDGAVRSDAAVPDAGTEPTGVGGAASGAVDSGSRGVAQARQGAASDRADAVDGGPAGGVEPAGPEVCPPQAPEPRLVAAPLVVGSPPTLLLACQGRVEALGWSPAWEGLLRFAVLELEPEVPGVLVEPAAPAAGDVTGDGHPDLLLGFTFRGDGGVAVGGALHLVPQEATGGFGEARRLVSAPVLSAATAQLDGQGGQEVLAVLRGERLGGQPGEVRSWRGGIAPEPLGRLPMPNGLRVATWFDLDGDGTPDLLGAAPGTLLAVLGDGRGGFRGPPLLVPLEGLRSVAANPLLWAALVDGGVRLPEPGGRSVLLDGGAAAWRRPVLEERDSGPGAPLLRLGESGMGLWAAGVRGGAWLGVARRGGGVRWQPLDLPSGEVAAVAASRDRTWALWRGGPGRPWKLLALGPREAVGARIADAPVVLHVRLP